MLVVAVLSAVVPFALVTAPARAQTVSQRFLAKLNDLRSSKNLGALGEDQALTSFAQGWSDHMAQAGALSHHPTLETAPGQWTRAGENIGFGPDADNVFASFIASPHHYANMVAPSFNTIGVGVSVRPDGTIYTVYDFEARPATTAVAPRPRASAAVARAAAKPRPATSPSVPRPAVAKPAATTMASLPPMSVSSTSEAVDLPVSVPLPQAMEVVAPPLLTPAPGPAPVVPIGATHQGEPSAITSALAVLLLLCVSSAVIRLVVLGAPRRSPR